MAMTTGRSTRFRRVPPPDPGSMTQPRRTATARQEVDHACRCPTARPAASRCDTNPGRSASSSRRADTPAAPLGPAASTMLRAAAGRNASCSGCSRPLASTPTTASVLGSPSRRLSKMLAAFPASGASPGSVTMASLDSSSARRNPATSAAAGPPPAGSSEVKIDWPGDLADRPDDDDRGDLFRQ